MVLTTPYTSRFLLFTPLSNIPGSYHIRPCHRDSKHSSVTTVDVSTTTGTAEVTVRNAPAGNVQELGTLRSSTGGSAISVRVTPASAMLRWQTSTVGSFWQTLAQAGGSRRKIPGLAGLGLPSPLRHRSVLESARWPLLKHP